MIESFLSVGTQVLILFLMIGTGFVLGKLHLITHKGAVSMSNLLMYVVSPCILIVVFQRPLETETFHNFWVALLAALVIHGINILVSELVVRDRDPMRKSFFRFSAIFSNCGFMAVPLQTAILGSLGVFYGSAYLLVFTVLTWTLGIQLVKGGKMAFSWRTLLMNPGVIGVVIAMVLYLLQITLPEIILSPITYLSDMNTPLPMVVIGYQLSQADFRRALHGASFWVSAALRLVILPLLALGGVTIFIFVERFMAIRKASVLDMNFMNRIRDYISDGKISTAVNLCKKTDTPIARMIEKGIERIGRPMSDVQTAIENVANLEVSKLENGLPFLATIAGGAPMIGFLGTVLGMVQTFMDMSAAGGTVDLGLLSSGMYVAMVTTVMGLIVGIPAYFGYNYLVARIEKLVFQMEANSIAFMDILNQPVQK